MARRPPAVTRVLERVTATAREHGMFEKGDRVLVAVSGGPDSTCLLYSLHLLRRLFGIRLAVFHFDHRLRPDSGKDAAYVRRLAARLRLELHLRAAGEAPPAGASVEAWARMQRWSAAEDVLRRQHLATVALGHTVDDQAETMLLGLIRGGGLRFVSGMPPKDDAHRVRPLLHVRRSEVEAFVRALGLRPRRDPTNRDTRFTRNAIRLRVIPELERVTGRDVRATFARTAELLREDAEELDRQAAEALRRVAVGKLQPGPEGHRLRARALGSLRPAIAGRVVQTAMWELGVVPERETVRAVLDLAGGRPGRSVDLPQGLIAVRDREYVRLSRASPGDRR